MLPLAWKIKETSWSSPAQIQIYMVKSMIPAAGVLLIIQGISEVLQINHLYSRRQMASKNGCCRRNRKSFNETS
jgi:TRAP-type mannitol/chloroaromatic compound transport system permease small subunit